MVTSPVLFISVVSFSSTIEESTSRETQRIYFGVLADSAESAREKATALVMGKFDLVEIHEIQTYEHGEEILQLETIKLANRS